MPPFAINNSKIDPLMSPMVHRIAAGGDGIFIVGTGAPGFMDGTVQPALPLEIPSGNVGDLLVAYFACGPAGAWNPVEGVKWTNRLGAAGGGMGVFDRIATNDANDNFTMPATFTGTRLFNIHAGQVIRLRARNGNPVAHFQTGTVDTTTSRNAWEMLSMTAGAEPTETFVIGAYVIGGDTALSGQATAMTPIGTIINLSDVSHGGVSTVFPKNFYYHSAWGYRFDAISAAASAESIVHSPTLNANAFTEQVSGYLRYRAI